MVRYKLDGKVAIITGASAGLGEQFAYAFAENGSNVVLAARRKQLLEEVSEKIRQDCDVDVLVVKTDVRNESEIIKLIDKTVEKFGTVDVLINNAGMYVSKPLIEQTLDDWNCVIEVNLTAAFLASREVAKVMIPNKTGSIINISSTFGFGGTEFPEVSYYATKGGLISMTKALAVELGPHNIRVNAIAPGFFPTAMLIEALNDEKIRERVILPRTALPMLAENEWIKGAACFLASDDSRYITGHTLAVDGGWLAF